MIQRKLLSHREHVKIPTWEFDTIASCVNIAVPISNDECFDGMVIDWGDGSTTVCNAEMDTLEAYMHYYTEAGQYHITVSYNNWESILLPNSAVLTPTITIARASISKIYKLPQVANTDFSHLFYEYNDLLEIEDGLFDNNLQAVSFNSTFYNCYQMTTLPENLFANHTLVTDFGQTFRDAGRIDGQTLYIGSSIVTSADQFMYETASYGNLNTVYVPANSTTESTFNSAFNIGCTIATY